ncbi:MAG: type II toxin-antitoxin system RelE/ParE family toxin [Bdellovibrionales bacterium]
MLKNNRLQKNNKKFISTIGLLIISLLTSLISAPLMASDSKNICRQKYSEVKIKSVEFTRKAKNEFRKLQPHLANKVKGFLKEASKSQPKNESALKWDLKRIKYLGPNNYSGFSVRINQAYRLIYQLNGQDRIVVDRISKKATHGGH